MAYTRGRCTNVDYCSLAAERRDIEVKLGEDFVCPECAKPLHTPPTRAASSGLNIAVAGAAVAVLLIGGGIYAGYRLSNTTPAAVTLPATPITAATPPPAPPRLAAATPVAAAPAAPAAPAMAVPAPQAAPEQTTLLRLSGSATLGAGAAPRLAAAYLASLGDTGVVTRPGEAAGTTLVSGQRLGRTETIAISTQPGEAGTSAGLAALAGGRADLALADRRVNQREQAGLRAGGDLASPASEHLVGREGEVVIVNPRNAASQLTPTQLAGILSGSLTTWPAPGGPGPVHLVEQAGFSGAAGLLPGAEAAPPRSRHVPDADEAVLADPLAIAVVPLTKAGHAKRLAIASVGAPPATPTQAAIADESYPLARKLYLYTPPSGSNPFAQRFAAFAASPEGQAAVAEAGLVPLSVVPTAAPVPLTPKDRYKKLVTGATRLAADLHFEPNSNKLDLHSLREVDRVWNFMMSDHTPSDHLILIGFADNQGTLEKNLALSQQRAHVVAEVFTRRGLPPGQVVAFGSDLAVADNGGEEGRQKNRRVEVFLRP